MKRYTIKSIVYNSILSLFVVFSLCVFIFGEAGFIRHFAINKEVTETKKELLSLQGEIKALKKELVNWKSDPFYLEKLVREELGMGYKNEVVYLLKGNSSLHPQHKAVS